MKKPCIKHAHITLTWAPLFYFKMKIWILRDIIQVIKTNIIHPAAGKQAVKSAA